MRYTVKDGIHIVEVPAQDFKIIMCNEKKKSASAENYCNAGFFAAYREAGTAFTLPVGHVICDFNASNQWVRYYCKQQGEFTSQNKYKFDCSKFDYNNPFCGKKVSTLAVFGGSATIMDTASLPDGLDYAISGVPIMRDGEDVKFDSYVRGQGWDGSTLYGTWHIFVGLKQDGKVIYVMGMKTTSGNMIKSAEAFRKFKALGMRDVIKLDGGGSFIMNVNGKAVASTLENRRINTIITFGKEQEHDGKNPYQVPSVTLRHGNGNTEGNRWLQWQLNYLGYPCSIDGSFGPATKKQVIAFQAKRGLATDGSVGPATRKALLEM